MIISFAGSSICEETPIFEHLSGVSAVDGGSDALTAPLEGLHREELLGDVSDDFNGHVILSVVGGARQEVAAQIAPLHIGGILAGDPIHVGGAQEGSADVVVLVPDAAIFDGHVEGDAVKVVVVLVKDANVAAAALVDDLVGALVNHQVVLSDGAHAREELLLADGIDVEGSRNVDGLVADHVQRLQPVEVSLGVCRGLELLRGRIVDAVRSQLASVLVQCAVGPHKCSVNGDFFRHNDGVGAALPDVLLLVDFGVPRLQSELVLLHQSKAVAVALHGSLQVALLEDEMVADVRLLEPVSVNQRANHLHVGGLLNGASNLAQALDKGHLTQSSLDKVVLKLHHDTTTHERSAANVAPLRDTPTGTLVRRDTHKVRHRFPGLPLNVNLLGNEPRHNALRVPRLVGCK